MKPWQRRAGGPTEVSQVRCAVRFPIALPATIQQEDGPTYAETENISASGVLMYTKVRFDVQEPIVFSMKFPAAQLGIGREIVVYCSGRVVRCYEGTAGFHTAATIDEYRFSEKPDW